MSNTDKKDTTESVKVEVLPLDTLGTIVKAEIDMQIATAKAFPRDLTLFINRVEQLATRTPAVAESCSYALTRSQLNEKSGQYEKKILSGPSVRFAEIVVSSYGNIRAAARAISNDGRFVTCQGVCHDLETNTVVSVEVKRKVTNKFGRPFSEDMQVVTTNAGCAIAFRNAVFKVIPAAMIGEVYEKVQEVAKGTEADLPARRQKAMNFFKAKGITEEQIFETLVIKTVEEIDLEKLQILSGMKASLVNNEFTLEELFPKEEEDPAKTTKDKSKKAEQATLNMMDGKKK
jgi:hypothetical protein